MTDRNTDTDTDASRRSFVRDGALTTGGLALALSATGTAGAQNDSGNTTVSGTATGDGAVPASGKGLIFIGAFNPNARFAFVSDAIQWAPSFGAISAEQFSGYRAYMIRWGNTGNVVPLWVSRDSDIGRFDSDRGFIADDEESDQPQLYEMDREYTPLGGDSPQIVAVSFRAVSEEREDNILEDEDWW